MVSLQTLPFFFFFFFYQIQTSHCSSQLANLLQLGREGLLHSDSLWKRDSATSPMRGIQSGEGEMEGTHSFRSAFMACLVKHPEWLSDNRCKPVWSLGESEIFPRKNLLGSVAIKRVLHWLTTWSNPSKVLERSKESSRNLKVMPHSSLLTAGLTHDALMVQAAVCG